MKRWILFLCITPFLTSAQEKIMGFSDSRTKNQLDWEKQFDAALKGSDQDTWMKFLSSRPHHVGSPQGKANADYMVNLFRSWGYQAQLEEYHVLFPTPKTRLVELLGARPYKLKLEETSFPEDLYTGQKSEQLPPYNAYSADGEVTAPLVFVNRGVPADYEELARMGIEVKGKIVIAKYGYCAWDGEEPALLGSVEWTEHHQEELRQKAVAYINTDGNSRGFIGAGGSHTLEAFFNEVAGQVKDPQTGVNIIERKYAKALVDADPAGRIKLLGNKTIRLSALGAGSDWSGFLQFLGIPSLNLGFGGEGGGGEYHTIYDTYTHFTRFKDPGFQYGVALSKTTGRLMMRLANADILPFEFNQFSKTIHEYAGELKTLIDQMRTNTETENIMLSENLYQLAKDPTIPYVVPGPKDLVPYLNFSMLENALVQLKNSAEEFQKSSASALGLAPDKQKELNRLLYQVEKSLLQTEGLPRRPWYKHQIYAPGYYTGYGVKTMPGVREGIEQRNFREAQENIEILGKTLTGYTEEINKTLTLLKAKS